MTKQICFLLFVLLSMQGFAQTGIGTSTPHASAKLDVTSTNKGFLPPRVTLTAATDAVTIPSPATGLLVYNVGSVGLQAGYYYWNGASWSTIATASSPDQMVDYVSVMLTTHQSNNAIGQNIKFQTILSGNIPYNASTGNFSLTAGKTYRLSALASLDGVGSAANSALDLIWRTADGVTIGPLASLINASSNSNYSGQGVVDFIYTPSNNTTVSLYVSYVNNPNTTLRAYSTNAIITQIGSSAIINPWTLSGTNTFNTTGNVGIGTNNPTAKLNIAGGGVRIASGLGNNSTRPSVNTSTIGNYEIKGVGGGASQNDGQDDGFLRLSAGGGTNATQQSSIDLSGYSASVPDMNNTIVMRTAGAERLRIDNSGNVNMTGKLNIGDPTGNVSTKAAGFVGRGEDITLGNLKVRFSASGNMSLQVSTVSGTYSVYGSFVKIASSVGYNTIDASSPLSITTTPAFLNTVNNFLGAGDTGVWTIMDTSNRISWRISMIIGAAYNNNFISIERLF